MGWAASQLPGQERRAASMARTLLDVLHELDHDPSFEAKAEVRDMAPDQLFWLHFGLGMYLRKAYIYPSGIPVAEQLRRERIEPDVASSLLSRLYSLHLQGVELAAGNLVSHLQAADHFDERTREAAARIFDRSF